ncbi:MAG: hypothetical protein R6X18_20090 [Chloroflexota bacterium]
MRGDEAFSFGFVRLPISEVIPEIIDQGDPCSPLPYLLLNIWTGMTGISELALRYPSALAGRYSWPFSSPWAGAWAAARPGLWRPDSPALRRACGPCWWVSTTPRQWSG